MARNKCHSRFGHSCCLDSCPDETWGNTIEPDAARAGLTEAERAGLTALTGLHAHANVPGFEATEEGRARPVDELVVQAAQAVDEGPPDRTAYVDCLGALVRSGYTDDVLAPLANAIVADLDIDGARLLTDTRTALAEPEPHLVFAGTESGEQLRGLVSAIVLADICRVVPVDVDGKKALWVYAEFVATAGFDTLRDWVLPEHWPSRGPGFFESMERVGAQNDLMNTGPWGDVHWAAVYREKVNLQVRKLDTLLRCSYYEKTGDISAMSYELVESMPTEPGEPPPLEVDRGFLCVSSLAAGQFHVRALKVVGFTQDLLDVATLMCCPLWTTFVKRAATTPGLPVPESGGSDTELAPQELTDIPVSSGTAPGDLWGSVLDPASCARRTGELTSFYTSMAADAWPRAASGDYDWTSYSQDAMTVWSRMARDWAVLWKQGTAFIDELANIEPGLPGTAGGPGGVGASRWAPGEGIPSGAEASASLVGSLPLEGATLSTRPLMSIESPTSTMDAARQHPLKTKVQDNPAVAVKVDTKGMAAGLYLGDLVVEGGQGGSHVPIQVYVSGAVSPSDGP